MTPKRLAILASPSWRFVLWGAIFGCLLVPMLAMQVTDEVAWTGSDFIAATVLLVGAGSAFELLARSRLSQRVRAVAGIAIATVVALMWAHGAVGVF